MVAILMKYIRICLLSVHSHFMMRASVMKIIKSLKTLDIRYFLNECLVLFE